MTFRVLYFDEQQKLQSYTVMGVRSFNEAIQEFISITGYTEKNVYSVSVID